MRESLNTRENFLKAIFTASIFKIFSKIKRSPYEAKFMKDHGPEFLGRVHQG